MRCCCRRCCATMPAMSATGTRCIAAQGDWSSRPAGLILTMPLLPACGLRPLYSGGGGGAVAATLSSVRVGPIPGQSGWLVRNKLIDRLGEAGEGTATYRLDVTL